MQPPPDHPAGSNFETRSRTPDPEETRNPSDSVLDQPGEPESTICSPWTSPAIPGPPISASRLFPRRFGKFNLLGPIATGGMGVVFRAEELAPDPQSPARLVRVRLVALKQILSERIDTPSAVERFQRETQAAKKLDHPSIVPVYESGEVDGEHYFTMPFVTGGNLQQYVGGEERLSIRQVVRLVRQVAEGVQYAHEQGVIHRDIKPHNILLQPNTKSNPEDLGGSSHLTVTARLTDFGLARLVTDDNGLSLSQKGEALGTPAYMPPEQACGKRDEVGPTSDIYSLGALLYALLTGRPPFPRNPESSIPVLEILKQVVDEEPVRPRELNPDIPGALEDICAKCLQKSPRKRYAEARELIEALDDFLENRPTIRHTPRRSIWLVRASHRLGRSIRKHPVRTAHLVASVVFAVALITVLVWMQGQPVSAAEREFDRGKELYQQGAPLRAVNHYLAAQQHYDVALRNGFYLQPVFRRHHTQLRIDRAHVACLRGSILRRESSRWEEANRAFEAAREDLEALGETTFTDLELRRRRLLAEVYHGLGTLCGSYQTAEKCKESLQHYHKALQIRQALCAEAAANRDYQRDLARSYGFMGDTQLDLGDEAGAKESYREAARLRASLIDQIPPDQRDELLDALCQHARDPGNLANFYERTRQPKEAREEYLRQLAFYQEWLAPRTAHLPGEFWVDRAGSLVTLANLELDMGTPPEKALQHLEAALAEYDGLLGKLSGGETDAELELEVAWAHLVRGKAHFLTGKREQAQEDFKSVLQVLKNQKALDASGHYHRALAEAWLGRLAEEGSRQEIARNASAVSALEEAEKRGFNHLPRLEREKGFERVRKATETREDYEAVVKKLRRSKE